MGRKFKIDKNPYDERELYKKQFITLNPGVTVLTGCNGSGKTTLLRLLEDKLHVLKIPFLHYNNLLHGGNNAMQAALDRNMISLLAGMAFSSEGERISINIAQTAKRIGKMIADHPDSKEFWILFDAVDSGLSIDNICELKNLFEFIIERNQSSDIYIVISANEYEMCRGENCFDVTNCKYIKFGDYEEYRTFILDSRKAKDSEE